jgi:hypothetical protein
MEAHFMKYQRKPRIPYQRPPIGEPGALPRAVIVPADQLYRFPKVWMVGSLDAAQVGQGVAWEFDVILQYRSQEHNGDSARTWCIVCPSHKNYQVPAIDLLRERARDWGYCKVEIFEIRPPVNVYKRAFIKEFNQAAKPGARLGMVAS